MQQQQPSTTTQSDKPLPKPVLSPFPLWDTNFLQTFKLINPDNAKVADLPVLAQAIADRPKDYLQQLQVYAQRYGGLFKVCLGPKAFLIASDPGVVRHIMATNPLSYDKGILAEILEPIMGKGLIPADLSTARTRRRVIAPAFHAAWLRRMVKLVTDCGEELVTRLDGAAEGGQEVNMEALYSSVALDVIGEAVFNFKFGSVRAQSNVIDAVYGLMQEAEHRSFFLLPYWKVPFYGFPVGGVGPFSPKQAVFRNNLGIVDEALNRLIAEAVENREDGDVEELEGRDYDEMRDPSLLRFLVDMRGADATEKQLRDDLMTMLIAGHETSAALLTWATLMLIKNPEEMSKVQKELDEVLGGREPLPDDVPKLVNTRLALSESLRLFPQPPIVIRRALEDDLLPLAWGNDERVRVTRGSDIFILVWCLHRTPQLWGDDADDFRPSRFLEQRGGFGSWAGYQPNPSLPYPNEVSSDYAFLPFGAGPRKCVGDQFAFAETVCILSQVLQRFDVALAPGKEDVGMETGATIHTEGGLWVTLKRRKQ